MPASLAFSWNIPFKTIRVYNEAEPVEETEEETDALQNLHDQVIVISSS
jgi:hypothetical protein